VEVGFLRILFLTHYFYPEGNAPASRVYDLCKRWVKEGHEVQVITCAPNIPNGIVYDGYRNHIAQTENIDGIKTTRVWTYITANKGTIKRVLNYLSYMISSMLAVLFVKKPDLIIATSPQFFCGWAGVISSRLRRIPFILEIRDIWPESIVAVGAIHNRWLLYLFEWLEKKMYAESQHIVTVGEGYKQKLIEKGVQAKDVTVITNGVDRDSFHPCEADKKIRQRYNLDGHFTCGYVGTIGMACGLDVVIKAAKILKDKKRNDVRFILVGDGAVKEQLQEQTANEGLEDIIIFTGRQDKKMIRSFLSTIDSCLVHLRKKELFKTVLPSKIFEAAAMAKPIILGVEGCAADLVNSARAGICIKPESAEQLVVAIERLSDDRELCREFGQAGHKYVMKHYDRDNLARKYMDTIVKIHKSWLRSRSSATKTVALQLSMTKVINRILNRQNNKISSEIKVEQMTSENPNRKRVFSAALTAGFLILILGLMYRAVEAQLFTPLSDIPINSSALDRFPLQIHDWTGQDVPLDEAEIVMDKIYAEASINRLYSCNKSERTVILFIAASGVTAGKMVGHPPKDCNRLAGWTLIDERYIELPFKSSVRLPCKILLFKRGGSLDTEKKVILYYYMVDKQFCGTRSQLRYRVRRGPKMVNCIGQVQIAASTNEALGVDSITKIISDFAVDSAPLISDLFANISKKQSTKLINPLEEELCR